MSKALKIIATVICLTLCPIGVQGQTALQSASRAKQSAPLTKGAAPRAKQKSTRATQSAPLPDIRIYPGTLTASQEETPRDTVMTLTPLTPSPGVFTHDIESVVFVPKGVWIGGVSVSYTQSNQKDYRFLIFEDITADTYSFNLAPMVAYAFADDMAAGGKFSYNRSLYKIANADLKIDPEMMFGVQHLYRISHNYSGMAIFRNYFSLGRSQRFGIFNEMQLGMGGGQSKIMLGTGRDLTGTYEENFNFNVGLAPGLALFLTNYSAMEVNVGVLGFNYNHTRSVRDQIYVSSRTSKTANFKINLFSVTFGVAFYI